MVRPCAAARRASAEAPPVSSRLRLPKPKGRQGRCDCLGGQTEYSASVGSLPTGSSNGRLSMRQIWISKAGPPEVLVVKEAPDPHPAAGEMRVRVQASGVNFADVMGRMGMYPDLPRIPVVPGYEVAGRVDEIGEGVEASWIGREVFALTRFGGYADAICVPQTQVFPRPPACPLKRAPRSQ